MDLKMMLANTAREHADKEAVVSGQQRLSYAELDAASNKIANTLLELGVGKGDRVAMLLGNSPEFIIIFFGIAKTGAIAVPLDTRYKNTELNLVFGSCQPRVLLAEDALLEKTSAALTRSIEVISTGGAAEGTSASYESIMASASPQAVEIPLNPEDTVFLSYTSGPATEPQGAMFSHQSLYAEAIMSVEGFQQTSADVLMLFALPLYHNFGLVAAMLGSVYRGSTIVIVPGTGISISSLMEAIEKEKGTILTGVPYIYSLAVELAKKEGIKNNLSSLRVCASGGAPLRVETIEQFKQYYGLTLADIWGLTEAVCHITCSPIDGSGKPGSCGRTLPGWELKIVGEDDTELPVNQDGEIIVRGPFTQGYYRNPEATAGAIKNGWLHTGDIGRIDEDGYVFITGRKKDMVILKGQNVYPREVEEVIATFPKVAGVRVSGVPDRLRGEIVKAVIRLKEGASSSEQEIRQLCQERMADYKVPKQIVFTRSPL